MKALKRLYYAKTESENCLKLKKKNHKNFENKPNFDQYIQIADDPQNSSFCFQKIKSLIFNEIKQQKTIRVSWLSWWDMLFGYGPDKRLDLLYKKGV